MKFSCDNCHAKYQIADEKASGRTLKMTCRHCGHVIFIRGGDATAQRQSAAPIPSVAPDEPQASAPPLSVPTLRTSEPIWHVAINDVPLGPLPIEEVARKISVGAVTEASLCWKEGLEEWMELGEIPELAALLEASAEASPLAPAKSARAVASVPPAAPPVVPSARAEEPPSAPADEEQAAPEPAPARPVPRLAEPSRAPSPSKQAQAPEPGGKRGQRWVAGLVIGAICGFGGYLLGQQGSAPTPVQEAALPEPRDEEPLEDSAAAHAAAPDLDFDHEPDEAEDEAQEPPVPARSSYKSSPRPRPTSVASAPPSTAAPTKKPEQRPLTAEEKRLLESMGGGGGDSPTGSTTPSTGSTPTPSVGSTAPQNELTQAAVQQVVSRNMASIKQCHERATRGMPMVSAMRINVTVNVGSSGVVTRAIAVGDSLPGLNACIEAAVKRWHFPAGGDARFPIVFPAS
jgi:predicted Zn finger-like uncharacterized protein